MTESDDLRQFIHEITLRFERAMQAMSADIREELRVQREENRVYFEKLREDTREIREEGRAQREALFRILDRLDNGGAAPAG